MTQVTVQFTLLVLISATLPGVACDDVCVVEHPVFEGTRYEEVTASYEVTVVESWDASRVGDRVEHWAEMLADEEVGGLTIRIALGASGLPECGDFYFERPLPIDGSHIIGWCSRDTSPAAASLTLWFEEDPSGMPGPVLRRTGRLVGFYQHATEVYHVELYGFTGLYDVCDHDSLE